MLNQTLHSAGFTDLSDSSKHVTTSAVEISFTLKTSKIQGYSLFRYPSHYW